jgi:beta-1,4-galactosyltransferase 1
VSHLVDHESSVGDMAEVEVIHNNVLPGGSWRPSCTARQKVAVIVPFRDRELQLPIFLLHMHGILQRQLLDYRIFVVEQVQI